MNEPAKETPYTLTAADYHLTDVKGYRAQGVWAQIKKKRRDVCVILSDLPSQGAAVFTPNAFAAAPVIVSREHVQNGDVRAIVCNSGNANACTGERGLADARQMAEETAKRLKLHPGQILVCSTGIIGRPLPIEKVVTGIDACITTLDAAVGGEAAEAITTTDSHPKTASCDIRVGSRAWRIAGIAKGAGMIHPNMGTMLAMIVTDAPIPGTLLQGQLRQAVDATFNMITIDGDQSTNDTCIVLANGAAGGPNLRENSIELEAFQDGLRMVCRDLAKQIAADGEGATTLFEVAVEGASTLGDARAIARAVASSNLVKSAIHGHDPNWGRIVAAVGAAGALVHPERVSVRFETADNMVPVFESGEPAPGNMLTEASKLLASPEIRIRITLGLGEAHAEAWGCDLSEEYVTFNSAYTT